MADNTTLNAGTGGDVIATDDLAGVKHQLVKVEFGGDGVATMVSTANPLPVQLADGADLALVSAGGALLVDASGATVPISNAGITTIAGAVAGTEMQVDVVASLPAGTNNIGDVDVLTLPALPTGTNNIGDVDVLTAPGTAAEAAALPGVFVVVAADDGTDTQPLQLSAGGDLKITLDSETVVLAAGTNNIGDVDVLSIAAGDNNIGNVDIVTMPNVTIGTMAALVAGTANIGDVDVLTLPNVTLAAGTNTNEVVGDVAHSAGVAGNPVLVAGVSQDTDDTAPPNRVDAEADATRLATDRDGSLFVRTHGPQVWTYHLNTSTAQTDASVHAAPGAGLSLYVGTIVFSSGAATAINLFFEEGASTVIGPFYLEAVAGRGMAVQFNPPRKITANTALTLTTSASIAHSVEVTGFTAQG